MSNVCEHGGLRRACRICELEEEVSGLRAEVAELKKDAERYRWLRDDSAAAEWWSRHWLQFNTSYEIDAAIDAALKEGS